MQPWDNHTREDYDRICNVLESSTTQLAEFNNQMDEPGIHQRILAHLTSTDDSLGLGIHASLKITIENTFQLLTVSAGKTVQLLVNSADNSKGSANLDLNL